jgi:DNA-binding beta-propeller fold protein YncE
VWSRRHDGSKAYVATYGGLTADGTISGINPATNTVSTTIPVGRFTYGWRAPGPAGAGQARPAAFRKDGTMQAVPVQCRGGRGRPFFEAY